MVKKFNIRSDFKRKFIILSVTLSLFTFFPILNQPAYGRTASHLDITLNSDMRALLEKFLTGHQEFDAFLQNQPGIYVPTATPINEDFSKLPAPPTQDFKSVLQSFGANGTSFPLPFDLVWLQKKNIGELVNTGGSWSCSISFFFMSNGKNTFQIKTPDVFEPWVCGRYDGTPYDQSEGFLVEEDRKIIAVIFKSTEIKYPKFRYSLYWQMRKASGWSQVESTLVDINRIVQ